MLLDRVKDALPNLPPSLRRLGETILADYQSVAFMTVSEMSERVGVSTASVMRFAREMGFDGFSDFQREIRHLTRKDLRGPDRFQLGQKVYKEDGARLTTHIEKELENVSAMHKMHDEAAFKRAAEIILGASQVIAVGGRSTAYLAEHLQFGLVKTGIPANLIKNDADEAYQMAASLPQDACIVVIGFSRYLKSLIEIVRIARERGVRIISVTDSPYSKLAGDVTLVTPVESVSFMALHAAPLILISALLNEVSLGDRDRTLSALRWFESYAKEREIFGE